MAKKNEHMLDFTRSLRSENINNILYHDYKSFFLS